LNDFPAGFPAVRPQGTLFTVFLDPPRMLQFRFPECRGGDVVRIFSWMEEY